ncbi:MAG TPA: hypothetical protein VMS31_02365 [Pyrinomonadaceae bacterium]|nr:hypothetical protein [Pyrinomonadaceae bacterium]
MKSIHLRILLAVGLALTFGLPGYGYGRRDGTYVRRFVTERDAGKAVLDRNFKIRHGQELTLKGSNLKVKFDSSVEDSRCPKDVTCVWAGDARIVISVSRGKAKASTIELHTNGRFAREGRFEGYVIKLVELDPYPRSSRTAKPHDYVATLLIQKQ